MRIIRHDLDIADYQTVALPADGDLLSVAQSRTNPNGRIDLWSLDFEVGEPRTKAAYIVGTGNPMPEELAPTLVLEYLNGIATHVPKADQRFIGTVVTPCGLVWHVFEGPVRTIEGNAQ